MMAVPAIVYFLCMNVYLLNNLRISIYTIKLLYVVMLVLAQVMTAKHKVRKYQKLFASKFIIKLLQQQYK